MRSSSGLLERWCADARETLQGGFSRAGCGLPIDDRVHAWRSRALDLRGQCLRLAARDGGVLLLDLVRAFDDAVDAVGRALLAATMTVIEWNRHGINPLAARDRAARAIDRLEGFAPILGPTQRSPAATQVETISVCVAVQQFNVTPRTLVRAVADGRLTDHRPASHAPNAPLRLDSVEIARHWPRRQGQSAVALGQSGDTPSPRPIKS